MINYASWFFCSQWFFRSRNFFARTTRRSFALANILWEMICWILIGEENINSWLLSSYIFLADFYSEDGVCHIFRSIWNSISKVQIHSYIICNLFIKLNITTSWCFLGWMQNYCGYCLYYNIESNFIYLWLPRSW